MSKFTSFGGIYLVHQQILSKKLPDFINNQLGTRGATAVYKYSDLILSRC